MYVVLLLGKASYKCWLDPLIGWCGWVLLYPCWFSDYCFTNYLEKNVKAINIIVYLSVFLSVLLYKTLWFFFFSFCFIRASFKYFSLSCLVHPHLALLCLLNVLTLLSIYSVFVPGNFLCYSIDIYIAIPDFLVMFVWFIFFPSFYFQPAKWLHWRKFILAQSCVTLLIHSSNFCLLIRTFRLFTFNVTLNIVEVKSAIFCFLFVLSVFYICFLLIFCLPVGYLIIL